MQVEKRASMSRPCRSLRRAASDRPASFVRGLVAAAIVRRTLVLVAVAFACMTFAPVALADYAGTVEADNPVAYWRLGDAPGSTTAVDATGHGHQGSYSAVTLGGEPALEEDANTSAGVLRCLELGGGSARRIRP